MTPKQRIKREILCTTVLDDTEKAELLKHCGIPSLLLEHITASNVDPVYEFADEHDFICDTKQDFRSDFSFETGIPCETSRHYESKSVARKLSDGHWVGWTYWYGGGKHGEPAAVEWMSFAYELEVTEEEKLVTVRTFKKREATT